MITRFFRTLLLLRNTSSSWCDGADWTPDDERVLSAFLGTSTGARFRARLRNASLSLNASAVQTGDMHACGRAFGYLTAVSDIQALSAIGAPQDAETSEGGSGTGAEDLEHLTP